MMKKFIVGAVVAVFALSLAQSASAATFLKINDSSFATLMARWLINDRMENNNDVKIKNDVETEANSGENKHSSADDHNGSVITTGDADAAQLIDNEANQNVMAAEYEASEGTDDSFSEVNDSSTASVDLKDELNKDMQNNNEKTDVDNDLETESTSGENEVISGDSLAASSTSTGKAGSATQLTNGLNFNAQSMIRRLWSSIGNL